MNMLQMKVMGYYIHLYNERKDTKTYLKRAKLKKLDEEVLMLEAFELCLEEKDIPLRIDDLTTATIVRRQMEAFIDSKTDKVILEPIYFFE